MAQSLRVMVSSTIDTLPEHYRAIENAVRRCRMVLIDKNTAPVTGQSLINLSYSLINESDVYVGIVALSYGDIPEDPQNNPGGLSITELEYRWAVQLGKPVLLYIMDDSHPLPSGITAGNIQKFTETDPDKLRKRDALRAELTTKYAAGKFNSADNLGTLLVQSLSKLSGEPVQAMMPPREPPPPESHRRLEAAMPAKTRLDSTTPTQLLVKIALPGKPGLRAELPKEVRTEEFIRRVDVRQTGIRVTFKFDKSNGKWLDTELSIEITAADFTITPGRQSVLIPPDDHSPTMIFELTPKPGLTPRASRVRVEAFQDGYSVGALLLNTELIPNQLSGETTPEYDIQQLLLSPAFETLVSHIINSAGNVPASTGGNSSGNIDVGGHVSGGVTNVGGTQTIHGNLIVIHEADSTDSEQNDDRDGVTSDKEDKPLSSGWRQILLAMIGQSQHMYGCISAIAVSLITLAGTIGGIIIPIINNNNATAVAVRATETAEVMAAQTATALTLTAEGATLAVLQTETAVSIITAEAATQAAKTPTITPSLPPTAVVTPTSVTGIGGFYNANCSASLTNLRQANTLHQTLGIPAEPSLSIQNDTQAENALRSGYDVVVWGSCQDNRLTLRIRFNNRYLPAEMRPLNTLVMDNPSGGMVTAIKAIQAYVRGDFAAAEDGLDSLALEPEDITTPEQQREQWNLKLLLANSHFFQIQETSLASNSDRLHYNEAVRNFQAVIDGGSPEQVMTAYNNRGVMRTHWAHLMPLTEEEAVMQQALDDFSALLALPNLDNTTRYRAQINRGFLHAFYQTKSVIQKDVYTPAGDCSLPEAFDEKSELQILAHICLGTDRYWTQWHKQDAALEQRDISGSTAEIEAFCNELRQPVRDGVYDPLTAAELLLNDTAYAWSEGIRTSASRLYRIRSGMQFVEARCARSATENRLKVEEAQSSALTYLTTQSLFSIWLPLYRDDIDSGCDTIDAVVPSLPEICAAIRQN